jgi:hypothetical protein
VHVALRQECSCLIACSQGRRSGTLVQVRPAELLRGKHKDAAGDYRNDDGGQNHSRLYRIAALAATLRSSSASYQSFRPRAVSALVGVSPTQKPMLAMIAKLSSRARK